MAFALQQSNGGHHGDDEYAGNGVGQHLLNQRLGRDGELAVRDECACLFFVRRG